MQCDAESEAACWRGIRFGELVESKQGTRALIKALTKHNEQHGFDKCMSQGNMHVGACGRQLQMHSGTSAPSSMVRQHARVPKSGLGPL